MGLAMESAEQTGDHALRLALLKESRALPLGLIWDELCRHENVLVGPVFLAEIKSDERSVLARR